MIKHLDELVAAAVARGKKKMIVAYGQDTHSIGATDMAIKAGLAEVTLVGDPEEIKKSCEAEGVDINQYTIIPESEDVKAVEIAVKAVHNGEYDVLMKGVVPTDKYMRGILNKEWGLLPAGTVLSHVTVLEVPAYHKLLVVSDVAVLPCPSLEQKKQIAKYLIQTANNLGIECPKVALLAPSEQLLPKVVSSVEAKELSELGQAGELGNALFPLRRGNLGFLHLTPRVTVAVNCTAAGNRDILRSVRIDRGKAALCVKSFEHGLDNRVKISVCREKKHSIRTDANVFMSMLRSFFLRSQMCP